MLATDEIPLSVISVLPEGEAEPEAKPPARVWLGPSFMWPDWRYSFAQSDTDAQGRVRFEMVPCEDRRDRGETF